LISGFGLHSLQNSLDLGQELDGEGEKVAGWTNED